MSILCRVTRGELTESIHVVFAVVVNESGQIFSSGDPYHFTCVRSTLKPFQAAAAVKSGAVDAANFSEEELAIMCASHYGEQYHIDTVEKMIHKLGLSPDDFECGAHYPSDRESRHQIIKNNQAPNPFHNNCSGKHAGMLAFAQYLGSDIKGYVQKDHPVQKKIKQLVQEISGLEEIPTEIDGCSAPTPFMTLESLAIMFQKLGSGEYEELNRVFNAMSKHPMMISGTNNFDTEFIEALHGRGITKIGGESIRGITLKTKNRESIGIALKVLDGNFRALPVATITLLDHLKLLSDSEAKILNKFKTKIIRNHNQLEIGRIEATVEI